MEEEVEYKEEGVDEEQLSAVLHQIEISKKHQSTSFGLHLGMGHEPTESGNTGPWLADD